MSLSARRAWIEIGTIMVGAGMTTVALRKESVDRNAQNPPGDIHRPPVALRKESVDRNRVVALAAWAALVALRKESVDRNSVTVSL